MKKLDFFGVGPKIWRIALPYLAIALTVLIPSAFEIGEGIKNYMLILGIVFHGLRLLLYGLIVRSLLTGI
jgi:hypothetical protein